MIRFLIFFLFSLPVFSQQYYVTNTDVQGTGTQGSPWTFTQMLNSVNPGDTINVAPGVYIPPQTASPAQGYRLTRNGTASNPILIRGYTNVPGDIDPDATQDKTYSNRTIQQPAFWTYDVGQAASINPSTLNAFNNNAMPTIYAAAETRPNPDISYWGYTAFEVLGDYVIIQNFQIEGGYNGLKTNGANNSTFKNIYVREQLYSGVQNTNNDNVVWKNIISEDGGYYGFVNKNGSNNIFDAIAVVDDNSKLNGNGYYGTGYFFLFSPMANSVVTNIWVHFNYIGCGTSHCGGHGIVLKWPDEATGIDNTKNVVDGFIITNTYLEYQFPGSKIASDGTRNIYRNGAVIRWEDWVSDYDRSGARIANNANGLLVENVTFDNCAISFMDWDDGRGGEGPNNVSGSAGYDMVFNNITSIGNRYAFQFDEYGNGFNDGSARDIYVYNSTFYGSVYMFESSRANENINFVNCLWDSMSSGYRNSAISTNYPIDASFDSNSFSNIGFSLTTPAGTNYRTDPLFTDPANYNFTVTEPSLLTAGVATPYTSAGQPLGSLDPAVNGGADVPTDPGDVTPPSVSNFSVESITENSITVSWSLNEGGTGKTEYGTSTGNYTLETTNETSYLTFHRQTMRDLIPDTPYFFRVTGTDAANNTYTSNELTATTLTAGQDPGEGGDPNEPILGISKSNRKRGKGVLLKKKKQ